METHALDVSREDALAMWKKYQAHKHNRGPLDAEIEQIYKLIAKGKVIIRAIDSIVTAGLGEDGLPKLAIARADSVTCRFFVRGNGSAAMESVNDRNSWSAIRAFNRRVDFPEGSFAVKRPGVQFEAITPHIPPDIRPARGLENYHILWEAVWKPAPPVDPLLLRRIGKTDNWLVCGAWDLTPVERAVMADRLLTRN